MTYSQFSRKDRHAHKHFVDADTGDAICLCGRLQGDKKTPANKYHAKTTFYNGYWYDSAFEANVAIELDWRLRAGQFKTWVRQYPI